MLNRLRAAAAGRGTLGTSLLVLSSAAVSRGAIVVATVLLSHLLAPRDLGRILYFLATSTTGSILIAQGTSTAALSIMGRMLPGRRRAAGRALGHVLGFALAVSAAIAVALIVTGPRALPTMAGLAGGATYTLLALSIALQGLTVLSLSLLSGLSAYRWQAALSIGGALVQYAVLVAAAASGRLALGVVLSVAVMACALAAILAVVVRLSPGHGLRLAVPRRGRSFDRSILGFIALTTLGAMLFEPVNWLCVSFLLGRPGGAAQVAAFLAANQWFAIILFVPINLTQVTLPMVSRAFRETGRLFGREARRMLAVSLGASVAIGGALLLLMPLLLRLYSPALRAAWPVFAIIVVNGMIVAVQVATGQMLIAAGRVRANLLFNAGWAAAYLLAALTVVTDAAGLAGARLAAYALHAAATLAYLVMADRRARAQRPGIVRQSEVVR